MGNIAVMWTLAPVELDIKSKNATPLTGFQHVHTSTIRKRSPSEIHLAQRMLTELGGAHVIKVGKWPHA